MATVRAQRLLNNIIDGTTNATALETALGTSSTRADFQQVVNERSKARLIAATTNGAAAVGQSLTAATDFLESLSAAAEFGKNPTKLSSYFGPNVSSSDLLMDVFTNSNSNLVTATRYRTLGAPIYTSTFAKNYASRFLSGITSSVAWNMPSLSNISQGSSSGPRFWGANGLNIMVSVQGLAFSSSNSISFSTNGGLSYSTVQIDATNTDAIRDVSYGNGLWIVCGDNGGLYSSANGTTWTKINGVSGQHDKARYANGRWILLGQTTRFYSTNGVTWTAGTGSTPGTSMYDLQYVGNNTWIAIYNSGNILRSTDNGNSWTTVSPGGGTNYALASDLSGNVVLGNVAGNYRYSTNYGQTWTAGGVPSGISTSFNIYGIIYYGGNFIFASQISGNQLSYLRTVGGTTFSMTPNASLGINPVPSLGSLSDPSMLRVVDGRIFKSEGTTTFYVTYAGQ